MMKVTSIGISGSRAEHDVSTMDDVFEQALLAGRRTVTINVSALFEATGDTGQEIMETAFLADTQALSKIWWLWTTDVSGDKERAGTGIVTQFDNADPDEGPMAITVTLRVNTGDMSIQDVT